MAIERRQPLPAGRYWIDTTGQRTVVLAGWLEANTRIGAAKVEATEKGGTDSDPQLWTLFSTFQPLVWPGAFMGAPTIATPDVKTKADTVQRPATPAGFFDNFSFDGAGSTLALAALAYLLLVKGNDR